MNEEKIIQKQKKTSYNIYGIKDSTYSWISALVCAVLVFAAVLYYNGSVDTVLPGAAVAAAAAVILVIAALIALMQNANRKKDVDGYKRGENFEFLGLYNLSEQENLESRDILSRESEAEYLNHLLESLIFRQNVVKQAVCLTGESGCGKSTILSFFKKKYGEKYEIHDFSGNYTNLIPAIVELFGSDPAQELIVRAQKKKVVLIFDQFERYFFLDEEKKAQTREVILMLSRKNTALVFSLRQEYLADFMKEFDVNNMKQTSREANSDEETGILDGLTSVIRDDRKNYHVSRERKNSGYEQWKGEHIKQRPHIHLEHAGGLNEKTSIEPVGNTVFYCENQNTVKIRRGGILEDVSVLQSKCEMLFGDRGRAFYEKHKNEPLIQQQITYQMAEYEKKVREISPEELEVFFGKEDYEILSRYYDVQLTATGDYYNACRILYLLSSVRMNHVVMRRADLEYGLFENQFSRKGHLAVGRVIDRLEELQLIRSNIKGSDQEYEVAHDFIAQSFLTYSHSNMDRNVKGALDIYVAEFLDPNREEYAAKKREHSRKAQNSKYFLIGYVIFALLGVVVSGLKGFAPIINLFVMELSMLYLFHIYQKVLAFYRGKNIGRFRQRLSGILFLLTLVFALFGVWNTAHSMALFGIGLAIMGCNCAFIMNGSDQKASRLEMRNFGLKCALIGIAYAILHLVLLAFFGENGADGAQTLEGFYYFIEYMMMYILVAYAYFAQLTKENLYGRRMDISSDRA